VGCYDRIADDHLPRHQVHEVRVMPGWLDAYWRWTGGNIGAMPLEAALAAIGGFVFRKPIRRVLAWVRGEWADETRELLAAIDEKADAARKIAADAYKHQTGREHPDAPDARGRQ
jgi:hypothetical protein